LLLLLLQGWCCWRLGSCCRSRLRPFTTTG
jgi:hypothetical protein